MQTAVCIEGWTKFVKSACLQKVIIAVASVRCYNLLSKQNSPKCKYIVFNKMHLNIFNVFSTQSGSFMSCSGPKRGLNFCASPLGIGAGARGDCSVL